MTAAEAGIVRDLRARLRLAEERAGFLERELADTERRHARQVRYLERDKQIALERARKATDQGRFWHGLAVLRGIA